ncbi:MAG: cation:proton antiporter [Cellvibrionaceae bacterium]
MNEYTILIITAICVVSMLCQWAAWRLRLPAILFLLITGFLLGPAFDIIRPDDVFGDLLFPFVSLAVAIILFEGSLTLKLSDLPGLSHTITRLVTLGALITWVIIGLSGYLLFDFSWQLAVLFGALCVVTGPTVIMPMLRTVRPNAKISNILRWEGILIDPVGALFVVVTFEFIILQTQGNALGHTLFLFGKIILIGSLAGILSGYLLGYVLRRHWLPEYLQNLATLSVLFLTFSGSNHFAEESGLLAVTLMGLWLANMKGVDISSILNFKENLTVLFISGLFILLAARLNVPQIQSLNMTMLLLFLIIQFIARPVSVWVCSVGSSLNWREKCLLSWMAPRGIVAAAVSALFALRLEQTGLSDAYLLVPLIFMVIVGTVVLQSATAGPLAKWLKVSEPPPTGILIMGANPVARYLGEAIKELGFRVLLAGTSRSNVHAARMAGLDTFYGNPASEYADQRLDLIGMGTLLALSPNSELNTVVAARYQTDFGKTNMFSLAASMDNDDSEKHRIAQTNRNYQLMAEQITYKKLASMIAKGAQVKKTKLSDEYTYQDYLENNKQAIKLLFLSPKNRLYIVTDDLLEMPETGWTIVSLSEE